MNLHNELLNRVKRTWELIRPTAPVHRPPRNADQLIKLNLPTYQPEECPLCKQGIPVVRPGSKS